MKRETLIACPCCKGLGKVPLSGVYAETMSTIRRSFATPGAFVVANQHADAFGCEPTALNNRLARLEQMGLVTSERFGRQRRFRLALREASQ